MTNKVFNAARVTKIHGKYYDLSGFEHPGGPVALDHLYRREGTTLFEMHHPLSDRKRLFAVLEKYEIPEPSAEEKEGLLLSSDTNAFKWPENPQECSPFRTEVNTRVKAYFQAEAKRRGVSLKQAMKPTPQWWGMMATFIALSLYIFLNHFIVGQWMSLPFLILFTWLFSAALFHDGSHFALSTNWRINHLGTHLAPWAAGSWNWSIQHVIGHHANTNLVGADPDLYHAPDNWRYHPDVPWSKNHENQAIIFPIIWAVATISMSIVNVVNNPRMYNEVTSYEPRPTWDIGWIADIVVRVGGMSLCTVVPTYFFSGSLVKAIFMPFVLHLGISFLFMCFSQVSHLDEESIEGKDEDYFKHEILTTQDYGADSTFWLYFSVGLNLQAVHHLFPTISQCHYMALVPILEDVCKKHGVNYRTYPNWFDVLKRYRANLTKLGMDPSKKHDEAAAKSGWDVTSIIFAVVGLASGGTKDGKVA